MLELTVFIAVLLFAARATYLCRTAELPDLVDVEAEPRKR